MTKPQPTHFLGGAGIIPKKMEPRTLEVALLAEQTIVHQGTLRVAREPSRTSRLHLETLFSVGVTGGLTDGQLLERFVTERGDPAELAFAALVERHGLMVFRPAAASLRTSTRPTTHSRRRSLSCCKRNTLWVRDSLGPWLHRVACRAAGRASGESPMTLKKHVRHPNPQLGIDLNELAAGDEPAAGG